MDLTSDRLSLVSDRLSVTVAPSHGGRLVGLTDLAARRQWLWCSHSVPEDSGGGAAYDDVWQGGFDELFPNDAPTVMDGKSYPDHGELWSIPWDVREKGERSLTLGTTGRVTGVRVSKKLSLSGSELNIDYSLEHTGRKPLPSLFKLHPALAVNERCRIDLPGGVVEKVDTGFGNLLCGREKQRWPTVVDLATCRDVSSSSNEFVYVSDLPAGVCGVTDLGVGAWIRFEYPVEVFPYCWIFMSYGGWKGHNVVVLEPCTNYPKDLHEAVARGDTAVLEPGVPLDFQVKVSVGSDEEK